MLSIVIPTYKEPKENIVELLQRIDNSLKNIVYEVIIVDDSPDDDISSLVEKLSSTHPVKILHRKDKKGLTSAIIQGLTLAIYNIICIMDSDLQHPPENIPKMLRKISENHSDIVVASRYGLGGRIGESWGFKRKIISSFAGSLIRVLVPQLRNVKDPMSGYFMFNRRVIDRADLNPDAGFKILAEILVKGKYEKVMEVPYSFDVRKSGESKLGFRQYVDFGKQLINLMKVTGEFYRILKFGMVGITGLMVNEGFLWLFTDLLGLYYILSAILGYEISIISNFTLSEFWVFKDLRTIRVKNLIQRLATFNGIRIIGLLMNTAILFVLTEFGNIYYLISNLIAIVIVAVWDYMGSLGLVWRQAKHTRVKNIS